jgi:hypothetical protein
MARCRSSTASRPSRRSARGSPRDPSAHQYCSGKQVSLAHEATTVPCRPAGRR